MTKNTIKSPWQLLLYINATSPKSLSAIANLHDICEQYLAGQYQIEVVDLMEQPHLAVGDQIVAVPTVVRRSPLPIRKVVGDLSDTEQALSALQIRG